MALGYLENIPMVQLIRHKKHNTHTASGSAADRVDQRLRDGEIRSRQIHVFGRGFDHTVDEAFGRILRIVGGTVAEDLTETLFRDVLRRTIQGV